MAPAPASNRSSPTAPSASAPIHNRPFIAYLLDYLAAEGIRHAVLCTMADLVQSTLGESHGPIKLSYSRETTPLGTAGALRLALPLAKSDPVLVLNGDSFCPANLTDFLAFHQTHNATASLLLTRVPDISRIRPSARRRPKPHHPLRRKFPPTSPPTPGLINAGIYLLSQNFLAAIAQHCPVSLEKEIFPTTPLHGHVTTAPFLDIGSDSYKSAETFFASKCCPTSGDRDLRKNR